MKQLLIVMSASLAMLAGAAGVASAAEAEQGVRLPVMNASDPASVKAFRTAVDALARQACGSGPRVGTRIDRSPACRQAIWEEVMEKVTPEQKLALTGGAPVLAAKPASPTAAILR